MPPKLARQQTLGFPGDEERGGRRRRKGAAGDFRRQETSLSRSLSRSTNDSPSPRSPFRERRSGTKDSTGSGGRNRNSSPLPPTIAAAVAAAASAGAAPPEQADSTPSSPHSPQSPLRLVSPRDCDGSQPPQLQPNLQLALSLDAAALDRQVSVLSVASDPIFARLLSEQPEEDLENFELRHKEELAALDEVESKAQRKLEELDMLWERRRASLRAELSHQRARRMQLETELSLLTSGVDDALPAPGPQVLRFVDGSVFMGIGAVVIMFNMATIVLEECNPQLMDRLWPLDQCFLMWYLTELVLKLMYHQQRLLFGKIATVALNWLDLVIVVAGVVDQWAVPALDVVGALASSESDEVSPTQGSLIRALRLLRLARLARGLRILRIFLTVDLSWTEQPRFQSFIMGAIALNSLILGLETDYPWSGWFWVEQAMLIIFFFEVAVRLKRWGMNFFIHPEDWMWNNLDFVIVAGGVLDQWMMPFLAIVKSLMYGKEFKHRSNLGHIIQLLRLLRMVRILRLVRLVKAVKPLYKLMTGVVEAVHGMQWVMVLTVLLLYAFGLLATRLVGHGLLFGGRDKVPDAAHDLFPSVPESMFLLFRVMNGSQSDLDPFFKQSPGMKLAFVVFIVVANWAILAILTAVVSENMIRATEAAELSEATCRAAEMRAATWTRLEQIFQTVDFDSDGVIDWDEYQKLLQNPALADELCEISSLTRADFEDLFLVLSEEDEEGVRQIRFEDFVYKLQKEDAAVKERTVFRLEQEVRRLERKINKDIWELRKQVLGLREDNA